MSTAYPTSSLLIDDAHFQNLDTFAIRNEWSQLPELSQGVESFTLLPYDLGFTSNNQAQVLPFEQEGNQSSCVNPSRIFEFNDYGAGAVASGATLATESDDSVPIFEHQWLDNNSLILTTPTFPRMDDRVPTTQFLNQTLAAQTATQGSSPFLNTGESHCKPAPRVLIPKGATTAPAGMRLQLHKKRKREAEILKNIPSDMFHSFEVSSSSIEIQHRTKTRTKRKRNPHPCLRCQDQHLDVS